MDHSKLKLMQVPLSLPSNMFTSFLMINHPPVEGAYETGFGTPCPVFNPELMKEVADFYLDQNFEVKSEIWGSIATKHKDFIDFINARNYPAMHEYLRYMFAEPLMHGVAQGDFFYARLKSNDDALVGATAFAIYDKFITLMEGVGLVPVFSPEDYQKDPKDFLKYYTIDPDKYMQLLESHYGIDLRAPTFQGNHFGIKTAGHGLYSDRDIMALGVAIRIAERYWDQRESMYICDIGGGVGHLSYYLTKFGFKNLTTIDVPTVSAAAKYFLNTNLPGHTINIKCPDDFDGHFDLVINVDGLTGYGLEGAKHYTDIIMQKSRHFLSINKESDTIRVCDLMGNWRRATRNPFWLRRGYVEEDYVR